jgi:hypothetical protein
MLTLVDVEGRLPVALVEMQVADGCTPFSYVIMAIILLLANNHYYGKFKKQLFILV